MEEALPASAYSLQPIGLLPEIRIDTSRLDVLLSGFQRRLTALEASFERVAESAAEAAHKVGPCCHIPGCVARLQEHLIAMLKVVSERAMAVGKHRATA